jgi:hypothetical protein
MSGTSARRFGVEVEDPELEQRLRRIELRAQQEQLSNFQTSQSGLRRTRSNIPRVSGVRLNNDIVGGLGVQWTSIDQADIKEYDVEVSSTETFQINIDRFKTNEPFFVIPNVGSGVLAYVRVRGINIRGQIGEWSAVLNLASGQASFSNVETGAAGNITTFIQTSGFDPPSIDTSIGVITGTYLSTILTLPTTSQVLIFGYARAEFSLHGATAVGENLLQIDTIVDGEVKQSYEISIGQAGLGFTSSGTMTVPGISFADVLTGGNHRFQYNVNLIKNSTNDSYVTPEEFGLVIWEQRR